MTKPMIIGIAGKKRVGKDTVAQMIISHAKNPAIVHFATALKHQVATATGHSVQYIEEHKDNFRLILQGWGTDYRRKLYGENYWVDIMDRCVSTLIEQGRDIIVIPDVRFTNEVEFIYRVGGLVIRVERLGSVIKDNHSSETELDAYEFSTTITNNGTLEELKQQVDKLF